MAHLYLIRGLPGSGKSTLARTLAPAGDPATHPFVHLETDMYWERSGVPINVAELPVAHAWCLRQTRNYLNWANTHRDGDRWRIVVANTFVRRWEMQPYLEAADEGGAKLTVMSLFDNGLSDWQLAHRNVHNVAMDIIARMREQFEHDWRAAHPYWKQCGKCSGMIPRPGECPHCGDSPFGQT